jgi:hypothetical protein
MPTQRGRRAATLAKTTWELDERFETARGLARTSRAVASAYHPTRYFQMRSRPVSGLAGLDASPSHELEDSQWLEDAKLDGI